MTITIKNDPLSEMSENELKYYQELSLYMMNFTNSIKNKAQHEYVRPTIVIDTALNMTSILFGGVSWFMEDESKEKLLESFKDLYKIKCAEYERSAEEILANKKEEGNDGA